MSSPSQAAQKPAMRLPLQMVGGWEAGLLVLIALLFAAGAIVNPAFFGTETGVQAVLRDTARYAVMAVGMTFVIVNKDLDLSVGSTYGLIGVIFSQLFSPDFHNLDPVFGIAACLVLGAAIGLLNGFLVTVLRVPAFIATLTVLLMGRGLVLGLTTGKSIGYAIKARDHHWFFQIGETNALGFNNQILIALVIVVIGAVLLAKTQFGYRTFATGGNEQAPATFGSGGRRSIH